MARTSTARSKSAAKQPAAKQPAAKQRASAKQPVTAKQPAAKQLPTKQPAAKQPAAKQRASAKQPAAKQPAAAKQQVEWTVPSLLVGARPTPDIVTIAPRVALAIDGSGGPDDAGFADAVQALYGIAYTLKFARKKARRGTPFKVSPLEGRWWAEGWEDETTIPPREYWRWRVRLCVPSDVSAAEVAATIQAATTKKGGKLAGNTTATAVFLEQLAEQRCGRILHVGPFAEEPRSFAAIEQTLEAAGLRPALSHVEIYLSDPRRTAPAKLRTVLLRELAT